MKTKGMVIAICCFIAAAFLLGATGLINLAGGTAQEDTAKDRLIGVLITREHLDLFDDEGYARDHSGKMMQGGHIGQADSAAYQGRLYANLVETSRHEGEEGKAENLKEYRFDGLEGIRFLAPYISTEAGGHFITTVDEGISDSSIHIHTTDQGSRVNMTGKLYVAPGQQAVACYLNPVYQSPAGAVYALSGSCMSMAGGDVTGGMMTQTISENKTETTDAGQTSSGTEVALSLVVMEEPTQIALLQFDGQDILLEKTAYRPGEWPERIDVRADAQYMIVETTTAQGVSRVLLQKGDESAEAFYCREDGICVKQSCLMNWDSNQ